MSKQPGSDEQQYKLRLPLFSCRERTESGTSGDDRPRCVLFVVGVFVMALVLLGLLAHKYQSQILVALYGSSCTTKSCLRYEQMLRESIDSEAAACDNFYAHACGHWTISHEASVQDTAWENFSAAAATVLKEPVHITSRVTLKGRNFFHACLSVINESNVMDVKAVLAEGGIASPQRNTKPDFLNALFFMSLRLFLPVFFSVKLRHESILVFDTRDYSQETLFALQGKIKARNLRQHLRTTYEAFGAVNESLVEHMVDTFDSVEKFLDEYSSLPPSEANQSEALNLSDTLSLREFTPSVNSRRWDTVLRQHLNITTGEARGIVVHSPWHFRAVFSLHKETGEATMNDFVEALCVQILVPYTSYKVLESFYGSGEAAIKVVQKQCFDTTLILFGYDVNHLLLEKSFSVWQSARKLADDVLQSFSAAQGSSNKAAPTSLHDRQKNSRKFPGSNFDRVFEVIERSNPNMYPASYDNYPDMGSSPLGNWRDMTQYYSKLSAEAVSLLQRSIEHDLCKFKGFTMRIAHLELPFFAQDSHRGMVLGGLGARLAAAVYYDEVESRADFERLYKRNQDCLSPGTSDQPDLELQGAVAAVPLIWSMFEKAREVTGDTLVMNLPPFEAEYIPFLSGCYLLCGAPDGERMCNVPLKHSVDFARVYGCPLGSPMNPVNKCSMYA